MSVTLGSNPTQGNLVCVAIDQPMSGQTVTVKDANNNTYQVTTNSPSPFTSGVGNVFLAYLLSAPANASKIVNITFGTTLTNNADAWAEEFSVSGGSATFDKDATGTGSSGTTVNTPSITPTNAGSLLYAAAAVAGSISAPAAGGTLGVWTGAAGGISSQTGDDAEYDLSTSSATAVDFTQSSGAWSAMAMAFYIAASSPAVAQTSPTFDTDNASPGRQALGFYYDDDTYGPNAAGWPGIGPLLAIPKTFEMDCDTTSRNCEMNTAYMREPEGELPVMAWPGTGVIGTLVPPPKLWDLDCDTTSRNFDMDSAADQISELEQPNPALLIFNNPAMPFEWDGDDQSRNLDQFLAEMQVINDLDKVPQNFFPTADCTLLDEDASQRNLDQNSAPDEVLDDYDKVPQNFFPLFGWDDPFDVAQGSLSNPAVLELEHRELAWPIPAAQMFNAQIDWTADYDWQQSRDTRVVEDEDPAPTPQNFFPRADWTADYDWAQSRDTRVVEDEDERELVWPIPVSQILNLGWDQDDVESRWFDTRVVEDEDSPSAKPFAPPFPWDDFDVAQGSHFNPAAFNLAEYVEDDRSLQAIALQVIAMALQQMLAVPMLGLQSLTLDTAELRAQQMVNVNMFGIQEMENEL